MNIFPRVLFNKYPRKFFFSKINIFRSYSILQWNDTPLYECIVEKLKEQFHFDSPTKVQHSALNIILKEPYPRHVSILSETGSGKTFAYLLPVINNYLLQKQSTLPYALFLVLNSELCEQLRLVLGKLCQALNVTSDIVCLYQQNKNEFDNWIRVYKKGLQNHANFIISTPGMLFHHYNTKSDLSFISKLSWIILDEADLLISESSSDKLSLFLLQCMKQQDSWPFRLVLSAATFPISKVQNWSKVIIPNIVNIRSSFLHRTISSLKEYYVPIQNKSNIDFSIPLQYTISPPINAGWTEDQYQEYHKERQKQEIIHEQKIYQCKKESLISLLESTLSNEKKILLFVNTVQRADQLYKDMLEIKGISWYKLHKQMQLEDRRLSLTSFIEASSFTILICTDYLSRGLDIPNIDSVIQFDFATSAVDYLHRSGRTARMGRNGSIYSILGPNDHRIAQFIAKPDSILPTESLKMNESNHIYALDTTQRQLENVFSHKRSLRNRSRSQM